MVPLYKVRVSEILKLCNRAAKALETVAGKTSYLLFAISIGTVFLTIPVLGGCLY